MNKQLMKPSDVIRAAYRLIRRPENWTQHTLARDARGQACHSHSMNTTCWCAWGALMCVVPMTSDYNYLERQVAARVLELDARSYGHPTLESANDSSTHEAVLAAFRRVYRKLKAEGK